MAEKKIFTSLAFQSGAKLIAPKVEIVQAENNLTTPTGNNTYYTGSAGQLAYNNGNIWVNNDSIWTKLLNHKTSATISGGFTFDRVDGNNAGIAPFIIGSSSSNVLVAGLNASQLNGREWNEGVVGDTIVSRDGQGRIKAATPTADDYVATKGYVDGVAQGLTIIDPCYLATTAALPNHSYNNGTNGVGATMTASANGALSIDGNAVSNGKRILVKDQANNAHNGIYTVTNAGSGSAAFVLTRATDYDEQGELLDGDFVFVQEGAVNANRGFVQTSNFWTATTGTVGTHSITWTQFSGAGQISVTSNGSAAAPLTKSGDTINFGYSTSRFQINSGNLDIKTNSIQSAQLGTNSVQPAQLQDTGDFTMGGLTVNGNIANTGNINSDGFLYLKSGGSAYGELGLDGNKPSLRAYGSSGWLNVITVDNNSGKLGLGADASSPSGTLHVSTARYSTTELVTNGGLDNWDDVNNPTSWGIYTSGSSTVSQDTNNYYAGTKAAAIAIDSSNNNVYVRTDSQILVAGTRYKICFYAKASSSVDKFAIYALGQNAYIAEPAIGTSWAKYTYYFTPSTTSSLLFGRHNAGNGASKTVYIDSVSTVEDLLSTSANLSVNSAADDLVIANNDHGGLSIITPADKKGTIFFGDKADNDVGTIKYDHSNNSLAFGTDGDGLCLTLASDHSAKFEGGVGIGMAAGTNQKLSVKSYDSSLDQITLTHSGNTVNIVQIGQSTTNSGNGAILLKNNSGVDKIYLDAAATSYFNGGPVAIGATSGETGADLSIYGGDGTSICIHANSDGADATSSLKFKTLSTTTLNSYQKGTIFYKHGGSETVNNGQGVGSFIFAIKNATGASNATISDAILELKPEGHQDHKANPIVNSASIAGLQDGGACYDFDGTDDYIDFGSDTTFTTGAFTISAWINREGANSHIQNIVGYANNNVGHFAVHTNQKLAYWDYGNGIWNYSNTALTNGKWHHVTLVYDGDDGAYFYLDGVSDSAELSFGGTAAQKTCLLRLIGAQQTASNAANNRYFNGQIRDVKIFPSALDAADIRKLYSGENPKKNSNVDLLEGYGDGESASVSGWTNQSGATISSEANTFKITTTAAYVAAKRNVATTEGKLYKVSALVKAGSVGALLEITGTGLSSINSGTVTSSSFVRKTIFFTAASSTSVVELQVQTGSSSGGTAYFDDITFEEVGTLVDFTPQSASSSKWRNEALLGFYNGTVNNATLSQGNTYWNNIKQDATDTNVTGELTVVPTATEKGITIGDETKGEVPLIFKGSGGSHSIGQNGGNFFISEVGTGNLDSSARLSTNGLDVKIHNKLGVGGVPDTCHLRVAGTSEFENTLYLGTATGTRGMFSWTDMDSSPATPGNHSHLVIAGSADASNAGILFQTRNTSTVDAGVITREGYWGIGTNTPKNLVHLSGADESMLMLQANTGSTGDKCHIGFGCSTVMLSGTNIGARLTFERRGASTGGDLSLHTRPVGGTLTERLVLRDDGTQDHKANRIVNSQTLNDSWRSSEPSLRFDGSNDYVLINSSPPSLGTTYSFEVWIKPETQAANKNIVTYVVGNIERRVININASGVVAFGYYEGSGWQGVKADNVAESGKWHHIVGTRSGSTQKIYLNGVLSQTATASIYTNAGWGLGYDGNTANSNFYKGEIKGHKVHNRVLSAEEVKAAYNGEATPYKYADADPSFFYDESGSYTYWTGGGNHSASVSSNILTVTSSGASDGSSNAVTISASNVGTFVTGKTYKWQFQAKLGSGTTSATLRARTPFDHSDVTAGSHKDFVLTSDWVTYEIIGTQIAVENAYFGIIAANAYNANVDIRNIKASEAGEIAAYTPQSIGETRDNGTSGNGKKWYDTTTNNNDGTITGATKVGRTHIGRLDIGTGGGSSAYDLDVGETGKGKLNRIDFYDSNRYIERDSNDLLFYSYYNGFRFNSGSVSNGTRSGGTSLQVNGDRSVTATSATSTNLKQVARGFTTTIIQPTGKAFTSFRLNHALGTQFIHVSVIESGGNQEVVECAIRIGSWTEGQTGANISSAGTGVTGVTTMGTENTNAANKEEYCMVTFATAPAVGTNYKVVVMGI